MSRITQTLTRGLFSKLDPTLSRLNPTNWLNQSSETRNFFDLKYDPKKILKPQPDFFLNQWHPRYEIKNTNQYHYLVLFRHQRYLLKFLQVATNKY